MITLRHKGTILDFQDLTVVDPVVSGVTVGVARVLPEFGTFTYRPCVGNEVPAGEDLAQYVCHDWLLTVSADDAAYGRRITLSAQWSGKNGVIERLEYFHVSVLGVPGAPPPPPDFQLAVGTATGGAYATLPAVVPVSITRVGGFAEAVTTYVFDAMGSGITGSFAVDPASTDRRNLQLDIPQKYAAGGLVNLK